MNDGITSVSRKSDPATAYSIRSMLVHVPSLPFKQLVHTARLHNKDGLKHRFYLLPRFSTTLGLPRHDRNPILAKPRFFDILSIQMWGWYIDWYSMARSSLSLPTQYFSGN